MPRPTVDRTGQKCGRLTVLYKADRPGATLWVCRCDCGKTVEVLGPNLGSGNSKSCGCYARQRTSETHTTHGMSYTSTRAIWNQMVQRCTNPNVKGYPRYGGRGIKFDPRWAVFENFLADMGERPPGLTLERQDTNGPYSPSNCVWATYVAQNNNRRSNRHIPINGERMTLAQAARLTGKPYHAIYNQSVREARAAKADKT